MNRQNSIASSETLHHFELQLLKKLTLTNYLYNNFRNNLYFCYSKEQVFVIYVFLMSYDDIKSFVKRKLSFLMAFQLII